MLVLVLLAATSSLDVDWLERSTLAADRLTVAAVDESGQTRSLEQLWVSGTTEQVLELLNGRACLVNARVTVSALTCVAGGPLPAVALKMQGHHDDRGRRLDRLAGGGQVFLLTTIEGSPWRLLTWTDAARAMGLGAGVSTTSAGAQQKLGLEPSVAAQQFPWWLWPLFFGALMVGMIWGSRRRRGYSHEEVDALVEEERQRTREIIEAMDQLFATQAALAEGIERGDQLPAPERWGHVRMGEAMNALFGRWRRSAAEVGESLALVVDRSAEREVSAEERERLDQRLQPLNQLGTMLSQLAAMMESQGELRRARQLRARRAGLIQYVAGLREEMIEARSPGGLPDRDQSRHLALLSDSVDQLLRQVGGRLAELDGEESEEGTLAGLRRRLFSFKTTESEDEDARQRTARRA